LAFRRRNFAFYFRRRTPFFTFFHYQLDPRSTPCALSLRIVFFSSMLFHANPFPSKVKSPPSFFSLILLRSSFEIRVFGNFLVGSLRIFSIFKRKLERCRALDPFALFLSKFWSTGNDFLFHRPHSSFIDSRLFFFGFYHPSLSPDFFRNILPPPPGACSDPVIVDPSGSLCLWLDSLFFFCVVVVHCFSPPTGPH